MEDLKSLLKDWFGQEELLGRILAKLGSEKTSRVLEEIAEEEEKDLTIKPVKKIKRKLKLKEISKDSKE